MADFAKRPEVTVSTMGRVHNPSGEGVAVKSSAAKTVKSKEDKNKLDEHETKVKEVGTARRNITRKKSHENYDSKHKKQGGAGKSKWSDEIAMMNEDPTKVTDTNDPLYDDEQDDNYILTSSSDSRTKNYEEVIKAPIYGPMLTLSEFKIRMNESLKEYYQSSDTSEFLTALEECKCNEYHSELIKVVINSSCDEGPRERELTSKLLVQLTNALTDDDIQAGFEHLLLGMEEICIDIPDAHSIVGCFLARAVVDEVIAPKFLSVERENFKSEYLLDEVDDEEDERYYLEGGNAVEVAIRLLSREHYAARLEKIWGPGDGRPVEELKRSIDQLLKEYLLSRELDEAARCVRELNTPHYHHELIKRGVIIAMEEDGANEKHEGNTDINVQAMVALFEFLVENSILSEFQLNKGLKKVKSILQDVALDVPDAPAILKEFEDLLLKNQIENT